MTEGNDMNGDGPPSAGEAAQAMEELVKALQLGEGPPSGSGADLGPQVTLPYSAVPIGWGVTPIFDGEKWLMFLELKSASCQFGCFFAAEEAEPLVHGLAKVFDVVRQNTAQQQREKDVYSEQSLKERLGGKSLPPGVAEALWATINVDEDESVDDILNGMPLPFDPTMSDPPEGAGSAEGG